MSHVGPSTQGGPEDAVVQTGMLRFVFTSDATDRFTVDTPHIALCLGSAQTSLGTCGSYLRVFHREGRIFVKFLLEPLLLVSPPSRNALLFNPVVSGSHVLHTWSHGGTGARERQSTGAPAIRFGGSPLFCLCQWAARWRTANAVGPGSSVAVQGPASWLLPGGGLAHAQGWWLLWRWKPRISGFSSYARRRWGVLAELQAAAWSRAGAAQLRAPARPLGHHQAQPRRFQFAK